MSTHDAQIALAHFLEQEDFFGQSDAKILFLRAQNNDLFLPIKKRLVCHQTFKPFAMELEKEDYDLIESPAAFSGKFRYAIYLPTQFKEENFYHFALALSLLEKGGRFLVTMPNGLGASRFETKLKELAGNIHSFSKRKCRVFWCEKNDGYNSVLCNEWLKLGIQQQMLDTSLASRVGIFSWNRLDEGSKLLTAFIPSSLCGCVADFGAGNGCLCVAALQKCPQIGEMHLYDAEKLALNCAEKNLATFKHLTIHYHWWDVTIGIDERNFDCILMNPPFHLGQKADTNLGQKFILTASHALKKDGVLLMVANKRLPYEACLKQNFSTWKILTEKDGYKVIEAIK